VKDSQSITLIFIGITKDENGGLLQQLCLSLSFPSFLRKQESREGRVWIPAYAGMTREQGLARYIKCLFSQQSASARCG
jgi:hypothetical protein